MQNTNPSAVKPIAVVSSDTHVEYNSYVSYPTLCGDSYYGMQQLVDKAIKLQVPLVLAGDLFDKAYPDSYSMRQTFDQMSRMQASNLAVYFTQGQHELSRRQPWLGLHGWPTHVNKKSFQLGSAECYGLDYQPTDLLKKTIDQIPATTNVLVCHQVWSEFMGDRCSPDGSLADLPHVKMVLTGDYHVHKQLSVKATDSRGEILVLSPGSTVLQAVNEDPRKFAYILAEDSNKTIFFRSFQLNTRPFVSATVVTSEQLRTVCADFEKFVQELPVSQTHLPEHLRVPIWYVTFASTVPDAYTTLKRTAAGKGFLFPKLLQVTVSKSDDASQDPVNNLTEALSVCGITPDNELFPLVIRLLNCADENQEVDAIVEELLRDHVENTENKK